MIPIESTHGFLGHASWPEDSIFSFANELPRRRLERDMFSSSQNVLPRGRPENNTFRSENEPPRRRPAPDIYDLLLLTTGW